MSLPPPITLALLPRVLLALLLVGGAASWAARADAQVCAPELPGCVDPAGFLVRAYNGQVVKNGGKCLDYTPGVVGSPIFLNECSRAHPVTVSRLAARTAADGTLRKHEFYLRAGPLVIGMRAGLPGAVPLDQALELQEPPIPRVGAPRPLTPQTFVLDGDSIILASDRTRVVQVQNARGANGSPIVVAPRQLADHEFWQFDAVDGTDRDPGCAFVNDPACSFAHVQGLLGIKQFLDGVFYEPDYDTVIVVESAPILLRAAGDPDVPVIFETLLVRSGVTIRGDRRGTRLGPELYVGPYQVLTLFATRGNDIRFTGLRLRGGNYDRDSATLIGELYQSNGIRVRERVMDGGVVTEAYERVIIDHSDLYEFTWRGVWVDAGDATENPSGCYAPNPPPPYTRGHAVRVTRNFMHHNLVQNKGYGVNANSGAFPLIDGNTFVSNRHAIAATNSTPWTGYRAMSNLILARSPRQYAGPLPAYLTHDIDVHGTGDNGFGGIAGGYTGVFHNTFLSKGGLAPWDWKVNFELRGFPCQWVDFANNVSLQDRDDTAKLKLSDNPVIEALTVGSSEHILRIARQPNQFEHDNPTAVLGRGDFDGDGLQDLFLATGAAWYYAPAGRAEWRLLSPDKTDRIGSLRFGDFDGDGRTDVIGKNGANVHVSWGGASEWEVLTQTPAPIDQLAVGNFDGLGGDDLFHADGRNWWIAYDGRGPFASVNVSGFRVPSLRFGDFDRDGRTDVFGVVGDDWSYSPGATSRWMPLRSRLTSSVERLFVADFDGDGADDVAYMDAVGVSPTGVVELRYRFSSGGTENWTLLLESSLPFAAFGRFDYDTAGILVWDDNALHVARQGQGLVRHSRQDMR